MKPNRSQHKPLTTLQFLRGDGNPSVTDLSSVLAEADVAMAKSNRLCKPPNGIPNWLLAILDAIRYMLRMFLYMVGFLLLRLVILIGVYIVWGAALFGILYCLFGA